MDFSTKKKNNNYGFNNSPLISPHSFHFCLREEAQELHSSLIVSRWIYPIINGYYSMWLITRLTISFLSISSYGVSYELRQRPTKLS